jgi:uncharacterized cupredoxin-like copper-binding protein
MLLRRTRRPLLLALALPLAVACTSTDSESDVTVSLRDDAVTAIPATADAGSITFEGKNEGTQTHELEVFSGDVDPSTLEVENNEAVTDGLTLVDEAEDITPGSSKTVTVDLEPGAYLLMCNLPGHFANGMVTTLTVS